MSNQLTAKIRAEIQEDFHSLGHQAKVAFVEADTFVELAFDYYKCKRLIRFFRKAGKFTLAKDYDHLRLELKQEIEDYLSKKQEP